MDSSEVKAVSEIKPVAWLVGDNCFRSEVEALDYLCQWRDSEPPELVYDQATIDELQAKIDWLMLEYCPEEMTDNQIEGWARHQVPADLGDRYRAVLKGAKKGRE